MGKYADIAATQSLCICGDRNFVGVWRGSERVIAGGRPPNDERVG